MKTPLFIRPLTENERSQIQAGFRSKDALVSRRSQVLLASDRGEQATAIAKQWGCHRQTVLTIIHGFNAAGLAVLEEGSSRPHRLHTTFPDETWEALRDLLHRSPRDFGFDTSVWTVSLAAQISFQQGLTPRLGSSESVRRALKRLEKSWKRAKHWITSPDPHYLLKKRTRSADGLGEHAVRLGHRLCGWGVVEPFRSALSQCLAKHRRTCPLGEQVWQKNDPDPKAFACYGVLWQHGPITSPMRHQMSVRFVDGRPISAITTQFLEWICTRLQEQGKRSWLLISRSCLLAWQQAGEDLDQRA